MSAYFVSKLHVDLIVIGAITMRLHAYMPNKDDPRPTAPALVTIWNADDFGAMLWMENAASVAHRHPYDWQNNDDNLRRAEDYRFEDPTPAPAAEGVTPLLRDVALFKLVRCLAYQSNERPDCHASNAFVALHAIIGQLVCFGALAGGEARGSDYDRAPRTASPDTLPAMFAGAAPSP